MKDTERAEKYLKCMDEDYKVFCGRFATIISYCDKIEKLEGIDKKYLDEAEAKIQRLKKKVAYIKNALDYVYPDSDMEKKDK